RQRPARTDVRLRDGNAIDEAGERELHHAVRAMRGSPGGGRRRDHGQGGGQAGGPRGFALDRHEELRHGEGQVRADEAARERGDDRAHRPRQDDVDGGDHEGAAHEEQDDRGAGVRIDRQRAGRAGAGDHDRGVARGVRDGAAALRAHRLSGARGLHQEHDHGGGADGRGDPRGGGERWADAADAGARVAGAAGERAVPGGVHEQGGHGGRPGDPGPGGAGGAGVAEEVSVSGGRHTGGAGQRAGGDGEAGGRDGGEVHLGVDGGGGQLHSDAGAGGGQAVPDADRGHLHDHGARDGGDGTGGARDREGGGRGGDRGVSRHAEVGGDGGGDVPEVAGRGAGGGQHRGAAAGGGEGRGGAGGGRLAGTEAVGWRWGAGRAGGDVRRGPASSRRCRSKDMATLSSEEKIRIRLKAYDHHLLDRSMKEIVETVRRTGARVTGP